MTPPPSGQRNSSVRDFPVALPWHDKCLDKTTQQATTTVHSAATHGVAEPSRDHDSSGAPRLRPAALAVPDDELPALPDEGHAVYAARLAASKGPGRLRLVWSMAPHC